MKNEYGYVYKITNLINNKIYIGKSMRNDLVSEYFGSGKIIKLAIKKYGIHKFKKEILCQCFSKEELNKKEREYIKRLHSYDKKIGYNITMGGDGGNVYINFSDEKKKEIYKKMGQTIKGRKLSDEHKKKIGEKNKGKIISEETKQKMRKPKKNKIYIKTKEHKQKIGEKSKQRYHINNLIKKPIQDQIIHIYSQNKYVSLSDISKRFDIGTSTIKRLLFLRNIKIKTLSELRKGKNKIAPEEIIKREKEKIQKNKIKIEKRKNELLLKMKLKLQKQEESKKNKQKRKLSDTHKYNLSKSRIGIKYSNETKNAISNTRKKLGLAKGENNPTAKKYLLITPDNKLVFLHGKFLQFCKDNKLCYKCLKNVADNKRKEYKGWKCFHLNNYSINFINFYILQISEKI